LQIKETDASKHAVEMDEKDLNGSGHFPFHRFAQNGFGTHPAADLITVVVLYPEMLTEFGFYRVRPCNDGVKEVTALPALLERPSEPDVLAQKVGLSCTYNNTL
jgi:hypothetical protein